MELRDAIDAISNLQIVQIVGRKFFDIYVASIALHNRFQGSSLFRFLENNPTLVIVTIITVLFFKALTGAFVPVEETVILSTTNDRCSRLILRSSLPWAGANYTNTSTTTTEHISQLRGQNDLFHEAIHLTLELIPMSACLYFAEMWTYRTAHVIGRSNIRRTGQLAKAQQAHAQNLDSMSSTLTVFTSTVQRYLDYTAQNLATMVKSPVKMANLGLLSSWLPHQQTRVLQHYVDYIEYLEGHVQELGSHGQVALQDLVLL
jgi:hypothetical protein